VDKEKIRQMSGNELRDEEAKLVQQLFRLRIQKAKGQLDNPQRIKEIRRNVARIKTALRAREMAGAHEGEV
jgi:large subunit ribosomal protein L29